MADELVAACLEGRHDLRGIVEYSGVDQVRRRQAEFVEQFEAAPHADPVAVVAPGKGPRIRRRIGDSQEMTLARAKGEVLDVQSEIKRQSLAARPGIVLALGDRRIDVTVVIRQAKSVSHCCIAPAISAFMARKVATAWAWKARSSGPASTSGRRSSSKWP